MAALNRATKANYVIHDHIEAETSDREDHTFCGIMFPIKCKDVLPVDHVVINSVSVRGALGPLTVWVTKHENISGEISMSKKHWTKVYEKTHAPSFVGYKELDLSSKIVLRPGQVKGIYIHSTRRGDEAIVYDNKEKQKTHDDSFITILPGRAHVSEKVFGSIPIWGWGSAWRDNREFVGQIKYGACYRLWNPSENLSFGENFRSAARLLFLCQRRPESPFSTLPDDCLYYILNMMRWDWLGDTSGEMRREQKNMRRVRRQQMIAAADAIRDEQGQMEEDAAGGEGQEGDLAGDDDLEEEDVEYMEDDSTDDSEDADTSDDSDDSDDESAASEQYQWGDHVSNRSAFIYHDVESDSDNVSDSDEEEERNERHRRSALALLRARRSIVHMLRSR